METKQLVNVMEAGSRGIDRDILAVELIAYSLGSLVSQKRDMGETFLRDACVWCCDRDLLAFCMDLQTRIELGGDLDVCVDDCVTCLVRYFSGGEVTASDKLMLLSVFVYSGQFARSSLSLPTNRSHLLN